MSFFSPFELAEENAPTTAFLGTSRELEAILFADHGYFLEEIAIDVDPDKCICRFKIHAFVWDIPQDYVGMLLATSVFTSHN